MSIIYVLSSFDNSDTFHGVGVTVSANVGDVVDAIARAVVGTVVGAVVAVVVAVVVGECPPQGGCGHFDDKETLHGVSVAICTDVGVVVGAVSHAVDGTAVGAVVGAVVGKCPPQGGCGNIDDSDTLHAEHFPSGTPLPQTSI